MDLTLFELHLEDAEFNAPFAGRPAGDREPASPDGDADEAGRAVSSDESARLAPVAAFLALVGLALLARYLRGGEAEQATLDEVEA